MPLHNPDTWFCRDLWVRSTQDEVKEMEKANNESTRRRDIEEVAAEDPQRMP